MTSAPFKVIAKPNLYRRQLHFENPDSHKPNLNQYRKRKGGTITPFGYRSGDFVQAEKAGQTYRGWIGGYTETAKSKNVSIYDINWKRIGQFSPNKVRLLKRSTKLLVSGALVLTDIPPAVKHTAMTGDSCRLKLKVGADNRQPTTC